MIFMEKFIYIIVPFFSAISAQIIKFIGESIHYRKLNWSRLFNGNGGMPSTHTSFTFSLTFTLGFNHGFDSEWFAIGLIFACIVAYDAMGLRYESGKQAIAINKINDMIFSKNSFKKLKEQLGHKPTEVLFGVIWAFICSSLFVYIIF